MIFATVGTQLPFPRLISAVEAYAAVSGDPVLAQSGPETRATALPHFSLCPALTPEAFDAAMSAARAVVAHAGIGTVLAARALARPLVLMPRRAALGEHRSDHQMATARALDGAPGIHIAWHERDLPRLLAQDLRPAPPGSGAALPPLLDRLRRFIDGPEATGQ